MGEEWLTFWKNTRMPSRLQNLTQANPRGGPQPKGARRTNGKREKVPLCVKPCRGRVFRQWEYRKFLGKTRKVLRDKIAGDDLVKGIYERRLSNRVPTE